MDFRQATEKRLLRYAAIPSQSAPFRGVWPTSDSQLAFARVLLDELRELGAEAELDEAACVLYARLPSNIADGADFPIGLIAHLDTAPDVPGQNVHPWVLRNYPGGDVVLNRAQEIVMRQADFPSLSRYIGQDLVLTDGTTLLGGDDKAAIAELMTLVEYYVNYPVLHRTICLAFTPDHEVGGFAQDLDPARFGARFAYTVDGEHLGGCHDQNFHSAQAEIVIAGRSACPGAAKGILINASDLAAEFLAMLPRRQRPQYTEGTEGFYHVISVESGCESARIRMSIRDFDRTVFEARTGFLLRCARSLNAAHGQELVQVRLSRQYRNMGEVLEHTPFLAERLRAAVAETGVEPDCRPLRGVTDGAALSFNGLPCANLSAGFENAHGRFEYVPIQSMAKNVEILIRLIGRYAEESEAQA